MADKIGIELLRLLRDSSGPFKVSIRSVYAEQLEERVRISRYGGVVDELGKLTSGERKKLLFEEVGKMLRPIWEYLEKQYGLKEGQSFIYDCEIRNVSALLTRDQIYDLQKQADVGVINTNLQINLPFSQ